MKYVLTTLTCTSQPSEIIRLFDITVKDLAQGLRDKQQINAVLLDFTKTFDKVSHKHLLLKLEHYSVRDPALSWIGDFLTNRTQRVMLERTLSEAAPITYGVPNGSVLGPLLFLCYINDLPACVSSDIRMLADDCQLYRTINYQHDAVIIQEDLNTLQLWEANVNGLCILTLIHLMY